MCVIKHWTVDIAISEQESGRRTSATATLAAGAGPALVGDGAALRQAGDDNVPAIGDELAAGRALAALSRQLLANADADLDRPMRGAE
jgi:hypothetical protein